MVDTPSASQILGAQPEPAPAAPAANSQPMVRGSRGPIDPASLFPPGHTVPSRGTVEYVNAVMAAGRVELGLMTREQAAAELASTADAPANGGDAQQGEQSPGEQQTNSAEHQFTPHDPIAAMKASQELAAGLQEGGEIAGLNKGGADFFAKHLDAALQRPPITHAQSDAQAAETWRMLRHAYGAKAEQLVADARSELKELAKRLPKLPAQLDHTGGGNEATIIIQLAQRHAERARARILAGVRRR